jgi:drug/metabolite transporter (DMT)-like permease
MSGAKPNSTLLYLSFAAVYLIWGTSFAASKLVMHDLPPLLAQSVRFLIAGIGLCAVALWRGNRIPFVVKEWQHFAVMGLFLVMAASGLNALAIRYVSSSESALLNVSAAFWIPLLGTLGKRGHRLNTRSTVGLVLGLSGVIFLMWPKGGFSLTNLGWQLVILLACFGWACGTLYYRRVRSMTPALMFTALEMVCGGLGLGILGLCFGDTQHWHLTAQSLGGLFFLTVFSSGIAYSAFAYLMRNTTPIRLSTYAYVNPAVAALIGWAVLGEHLSLVQIVGMAIILTGVVLVSIPDSRGALTQIDAPPSEAPP